VLLVDIHQAYICHFALVDEGIGGVAIFLRGTSEHGVILLMESYALTLQATDDRLLLLVSQEQLFLLHFELLKILPELTVLLAEVQELRAYVLVRYLGSHFDSHGV